MSAPLSLLGLCGSLRKASYNRALLGAVQAALPDDVMLETVDLHRIPPFNQDEEGALPEAVADLKERIRRVDGILLATPEYNYSVSGVLKNAIDWCSRPVGESAWTAKPTGVLGASVGAFGTARAQLHLRQIGMALDMHIMAQPELLVASAGDRFDDGGRLTHAQTEKVLEKYVAAFVAWVRLLRSEQLRAS